MTGYVCKELAPPQNGYVPCKTWVAQSPSLTEQLAITPVEAGVIGGSIIGVMGIILAYQIVAKASKSL